jgi:hypothetical protein
VWWSDGMAFGFYLYEKSKGRGLQSKEMGSKMLDVSFV